MSERSYDFVYKNAVYNAHVTEDGAISVFDKAGKLEASTTPLELLKSVKEVSLSHYLGYHVDECFEISVDCEGYNYLIIYGRHINGGFCAIPNWGISCEMAEPEDIGYNTEKLIKARDESKTACYSDDGACRLATEICLAAQRRNA